MTAGEASNKGGSDERLDRFGWEGDRPGRRGWSPRGPKPT